MANRTRNNGIYFILSDDELEILNKKYKLSSCKTLRQFIMKCLFEKDIFVLDMKVLYYKNELFNNYFSSVNPSFINFLAVSSIPKFNSPESKTPCATAFSTSSLS